MRGQIWKPFDKPDLDFLALPAGLLERLRIRQRTDVFTHFFIEVTSHFAHDRSGAPRLEDACRAVILIGPVVDDAALIDIASAGEFGAARADVDVALAIEDKISSAERAVGACRLVPHRNVRGDAAVY